MQIRWAHKNSLLQTFFSGKVSFNNSAKALVLMLVVVVVVLVGFTNTNNSELWKGCSQDRTLLVHFLPLSGDYFLLPAKQLQKVARQSIVLWPVGGLFLILEMLPLAVRKASRHCLVKADRPSLVLVHILCKGVWMLEEKRRKRSAILLKLNHWFGFLNQSFCHHLQLCSSTVT